MTKMVNHGSGRVRLEFRIPARGLIGFRSQFLTDTRGTGIMNHMFAAWEPWHGQIRRAPPAPWWPTAPARRRRTRSPTCRSAARCSSSRHSGLRGHDRRRELARQRPRRQHVQGEEADQHARVEADEAIRLMPPRKLGLEQAIEFINDDELVEVTPKTSACASACSAHTSYASRC
jgi:GTP-binding protein